MSSTDNSAPSRREGSLQILTPEGIHFSFQLAGPVSRMFAWLIDFFAVGFLTALVSSGLMFFALISPDLAMALIVLATFLLQVGYTIVLEWFWRGQTLGKRLLGLRVMDVQGLKLQSSQIVVRNLLRFVDMLPVFYLVGGFFAAVTRYSQRLGDLAANTIVVRKVPGFEPDLETLSAGKFNSLRSYPHLAARLRQRIGPEEVRIASQALMRREQMDDQPRVELFRELAAHFRGLADFPPEAIEGISDEQYVRNVVDLLLRPKASVTDAKKETQMTVIS